MEEECFSYAFGKITQAVGADPSSLEMTLLFYKKDMSKQNEFQEIEKQALDIFRAKKAKDLVKDDAKGLLKMEKKEAMKLQIKLQDISFDEFRHFYTIVPLTEREQALVLMEHRISDLFFLASGIEQDELDVVWNNLKLDTDPDYLKMQEDYHKKLA